MVTTVQWQNGKIHPWYFHGRHFHIHSLKANHLPEVIRRRVWITGLDHGGRCLYMMLKSRHLIIKPTETGTEKNPTSLTKITKKKNLFPPEDRKLCLFVLSTAFLGTVDDSTFDVSVTKSALYRVYRASRFLSHPGPVQKTIRRSFHDKRGT